MRTLEAVKHDLFGVSRNALLALFVIPGLSFLFIQHVQSTWNREFVEGATRQVEADATVSSERKAELVALFKAVPQSKACSATDPALATYRANVCALFSN